jgi:outer membrane usher protein
VVDRSLPLGAGYGFRAGVDTAADQSAVEIQGQNAFGYGAARFRRLNGVDSTEVDVAGGVAAMGRRLLLSRPLNASFALVQVPASRGVRVSLNSQPVGRTNRWGDLLVPDLIPYVDNRLSIADEDVPLDYEIKKSSDQLAPPYRGGAVVVFPVAPIRTFSGRIVAVTEAGTVAPSYGTLMITLPDRTVESPLSGDGDFYLENLTIGRYPATVTFEEGRCTFDLDVPKALSLMTDFGVIRCVKSGS